MNNREFLLARARAAEQSGAHIQMASLVRQIAEMAVELNGDERKALVGGYHGVACQVLEPLRLAASREPRNATEKEVLRRVTSLLRAKLRNLCAEMGLLINGTLLPASGDPENLVFYRKWYADVLRLALETVAEPGQERVAIQKACDAAYQKAVTAAERTLRPDNAVRLCTMLHAAIFRADELEDFSHATRMAYSAVEDAAAEAAGPPQKEEAAILFLLARAAHTWMAKEEGSRLSTKRQVERSWEDLSEAGSSAAGNSPAASWAEEAGSGESLSWSLGESAHPPGTVPMPAAEEYTPNISAQPLSGLLHQLPHPK